MKYLVIQLSKYIITKCAKDNKPINNLQLQKILYFIQKEYLQKEDTVVFDDPIEAWRFSPVVPHAYYRFCGYGGMSIGTKYIADIDQDDKNRIDSIVEEKRSLNPWDLAKETHRRNSAWDRVYANGKGNHRTIPIDLIKLYG